MCHEYGNALRPGPTPVVGATMEAAVSSGNVSIHSIEADDIGGVQTLYTVKSASKPHISGAQGSTASMTITGTNLPLNNVEVWFTRSSVNSVGTPAPLKLT